MFPVFQRLTRNAALLALLVSTLAPTAKAGHEILFGLGMLNFTSGAAHTEVYAGYYLRFISWLSIGGQVSFQRQSFEDTSVSNLTFILGPQLNLGPGIDNFFLGVGFALRSGSTTSTDTPVTNPTGIGVSIEAGKRFILFSTFVYRPSIGFIAAGRAGFYIQPLTFSYLM